MRLHTVVMLLCGLAASTFGDTYPRQTGADEIHYVFRLTLSDESDTIVGEATANVRFLRGGEEFSLDLASQNGAKGMTVVEVNCGGVAARYSHRDDRLTITLPAPAKT